MKTTLLAVLGAAVAGFFPLTVPAHAGPAANACDCAVTGQCVCAQCVCADCGQADCCEAAVSCSCCQE